MPSPIVYRPSSKGFLLFLLARCSANKEHLTDLANYKRFVFSFSANARLAFSPPFFLLRRVLPLSFSFHPEGDPFRPSRMPSLIFGLLLSGSSLASVPHLC